MMAQVPDSATVKESIATVMSALFTLPGEENEKVNKKVYKGNGDIDVKKKKQIKKKH